MKKVLFIVNSLPFFLSHRKPIADELVKQGYEVHLAAGRMNATPPPNILWHELPLERGGTNIYQEIKTLYSIYRIIKYVKPDLVHLVSLKPVLYGGIILNFFPKIKTVAAISGLGSIFTNQNKFKTIRFIISKMYKLALRKDSLIVIFQNNDDKNTIIQLAGLEETKTRLIRGSGVNLKRFQYRLIPDTQNGIYVTMASRLLKDKGVNEYIKASQKFISTKVYFNLIGDIDPQNPESLSEKDLDNLKQLKNIKLYKHTNTIEDYFEKSHIIVLPSYREGLPKVLCEAAAIGRAIVTTNVPGCRDAIIENQTGLLVPSHSHEELANAIQKLASNPELIHYFGINGRQLAENEFDINKVVEKHIEIYRTLLLI